MRGFYSFQEKASFQGRTRQRDATAQKDHVYDIMSHRFEHRITFSSIDLQGKTTFFWPDVP